MKRVAEPPTRCPVCTRLFSTDAEDIPTLCLSCMQWLCVTCKEPHANDCNPRGPGEWHSFSSPKRTKPEPEPVEEEEEEEDATEVIPWNTLPMPAIIKICVWGARVESIFWAMSLGLVCKRWLRPLRGPALAEALPRTEALVYGWFLEKLDWVPNLARARSFYNSIMAEMEYDRRQTKMSNHQSTVSFAEFRYNNPEVMLPFGDGHCHLLRSIHQDWMNAKERNINMGVCRIKPNDAYIEHQLQLGLSLADKSVPVSHLMLLLSGRDWDNFFNGSYGQRNEIYQALNACIEKTVGKFIMCKLVRCVGEDPDHQMSNDDWVVLQGEFARELSV